MHSKTKRAIKAHHTAAVCKPLKSPPLRYCLGVLNAADIGHEELQNEAYLNDVDKEERRSEDEVSKQRQNYGKHTITHACSTEDEGKQESTTPAGHTDEDAHGVDHRGEVHGDERGEAHVKESLEEALALRLAVPAPQLCRLALRGLPCLALLLRLGLLRLLPRLARTGLSCRLSLPRGGLLRLRHLLLWRGLTEALVGASFVPVSF